METFNLFMYKSEEEEITKTASSGAFANRLTKKEIEDIQRELRRQTEVYERKNRTSMAEERKKALHS